MSEHPEPKVVAECTSEFEANIVCNMLRSEGIPCEVVGGMIGGMRAEAPGLVEVIVPAAHAERARALVLDQKERTREEGSGED